MNIRVQVKPNLSSHYYACLLQKMGDKKACSEKLQLYPVNPSKLLKHKRRKRERRIRYKERTKKLKKNPLSFFVLENQTVSQK